MQLDASSRLAPSGTREVVAVILGASGEANGYAQIGPPFYARRANVFFWFLLVRVGHEPAMYAGAFRRKASVRIKQARCKKSPRWARTSSIGSTVSYFGVATTAVLAIC